MVDLVGEGHFGAFVVVGYVAIVHDVLAVQLAL